MLKTSLQLDEFRRQAAEQIWPAVDAVMLPETVKTLVAAYLGLGEFAAEPGLRTDQQLAQLPGHATPTKNRRLAERVLWAVLDPGARDWVAPSFYGVAAA